MNKLLIVGHPSAACGDIEDLLNQCGMATPLPSRKEGFSPQQIGSTILKASALDGERDKSHAPGALSQLTPGPVWQGLVLDLMLGNIDQDFWGWSDPNAVHLLDYWKTLDPSMKFVLVYSDPRTALTEAALGSREQNDALLDKQLRDWCMVNSAILRFHNYNRDRSILVHADEALSSVHAYLQQLRTRLNAPLSEPPAAFLSQIVSGLDVSVLDGDGEAELAPAAFPHPSEIDAAREISRPNKSARSEGSFRSSMLSEYFDQQLLAEYPEVGRLYEELQSSANLSSQRDFDEGTNVRAAWLGFRELEQRTGRLQSMLDAMTIERDAEKREEAARMQKLLAEYRLVQAEGEAKAVQLKTDNEKLLEANVALQSAVDISRSDAARAQQSHEQLLDQLHAVQEELEKYYLEAKKLKEESVQPLYGAAERVKEQLAYKLGALMIQRSKSWGGRLGMLGALKDLQNDYKHVQPLELGLPPISSYRDADEAFRVTRHLSYRLGSAYLANTRSLAGWLKLPFALKQAVREFNIYRSAKN